MASDMVERVAKALARHEFGDFDETWFGHEAFMGDYRELARAAIAAMREPTEAMLEAAFAKTGYRTTAEEHWQLMIDAALQESSHVR